VAGFWVMIAFASALDAYFTYLNKNIVDQGIMAGNREAVIRLVSIYGFFVLVQAVTVFSFIYLAGVLGERIQYDLRRAMFNHLQDLSLAYYSQTRWAPMARHLRSGRISVWSLSLAGQHRVV
jgi:ATP-binding cassette subfamily B protein